MLHHSSMNKKRLHLNSANSSNNAAYDRMCVGLGLIENTTTIVCSDSNHSTHNCQAVVFEHRCLQNTSGALVRRERTHLLLDTTCSTQRGHSPTRHGTCLSCQVLRIIGQSTVCEDLSTMRWTSTIARKLCAHTNQPSVARVCPLRKS